MYRNRTPVLIKFLFPVLRVTAAGILSSTSRYFGHLGKIPFGQLRQNHQAKWPAPKIVMRVHARVGYFL